MTDGREALEREESARIEELDRAHRARVLLEDSLFREAVDALRRDIVKALASCDPRDHMALVAVQQRYIALEDMVNKLLFHLETGEMSREQLGWIRDKMQKWKPGSSRR